MGSKHGDCATGIFWVTCRFVERADGSIQCDFTDAGLIAHKVLCDLTGARESSRNNTSGERFSHVRMWDAAAAAERAETRRHAWNHFPRGRVEIVNGTTVLFANPRIIDDPAVLAMVMEAFHIHAGAGNVRIIADGSAHYACYADARRSPKKRK